MTTDERHMRRALRLAALGRHASPNPMVGCVIVAPNGRVVGEGWHVRPGENHAEANALARAGDLAEGATVYVTLEPCAHMGRTPPCADALIRARVSRVVVASLDPNPVAAGGLSRIAAAGIATEVGVLEDDALRLLAAYRKQRVTGMPWVVLKTAMTLDGRIATRAGQSQWISGEISRRAVHRQLRDRCDAILTGVGTVIRDDPSLTTRLNHRSGRDPWRVIVDSHARTPPDAKVVRRGLEDGRTLLFVTDAADPSRVDRLVEAGCRVIVMPTTETGRVDLAAALRHLGTNEGLIAVVVESGPALAASLLEDCLVDRWLAFIAPRIVGGVDAPGPVGGVGVATMADVIRLKSLRSRRCGVDIVLDALF